jgi:hypothetical protein
MKRSRMSAHAVLAITIVLLAIGYLGFQVKPARFAAYPDAGKEYRHYIEATWFGLPIMKVNELFVDGKDASDFAGLLGGVER